MLIYIFAWGATVLIEYQVVLAFIRKNSLILFGYTVLINSFTLPIATYVYQNIFKDFFLIELTVVFIESILIMLLIEIKYHKALLISLTANFITAMISFLFFI